MQRPGRPKHHQTGHLLLPVLYPIAEILIQHHQTSQETIIQNMMSWNQNMRLDQNMRLNQNKMSWNQNLRLEQNMTGKFRTPRMTTHNMMIWSMKWKIMKMRQERLRIRQN